jgi:hypothetical protein
MKKILLLLFTTFLLSFTAGNDVYICKSANAKRYHPDPDCRGLKNCTHEIVKVSLSEAQNQGKTLCGYEK